MAEIYNKILEVQKAVKGLEKNGVGPSTQGSYKFLSVDDVLVKVKPLLDEHGIIVAPTLLDSGFEFTKALAKDDSRVPKYVTTAWVKYQFDFIAVEDGSKLSSTVIGEGADTSDKAVRKATTSAWKIALIQTFALITGEADPESQDGANVPDQAGPASGRKSPAERHVERAERAKAGGKTLGDLTALVKAQGRDIDEVKKFADAKFGDSATDRKWIKDESKIADLIRALEAGEV